MKILNFGSLNIDYSYYVDRFVQPGETMHSGDLKISCGGKGLNQSIAMARAGAEVWHAGAVGEKDGEMLTDMLVRFGVNTEYVEKKESASGHAIIQITKNAENCILLFGGANRMVDEEQIARTLTGFDAGDYLVLQNEINNLDKVIRLAKKRGMVIFLNPSPMDKSIMRLPLSEIDFFFVNENEAAALSGCSDEDEVKRFLALIKMFPGAGIVMTLGSRGAYYMRDDLETPAFQGCFPVKPVDTTAAGDTFMGYFIAAAARGVSPAGAMHLAAKAASIAVSRNGAATSIPSAQEVEAFG